MKNLSIRAVYSLCLGLILSQSAAANYLDDNLRKLNWNGVEVVWIEDNQYPTYDVTVYFYDGALSDNSKRYGETELMLDQITAGTLRYTQKQIANHLEFFGASYGGSVTHEFSTYSISGLVKDIVPTVKKVCHIFTNATFPKKELAKTKRRIVTSLNNIVTSHSSLANRAFRKISLNGTPYANPVSGTLKSIKRIKQKHLLARLKHFNTKVKKRIYIKGPSGI